MTFWEKLAADGEKEKIRRQEKADEPVRCPKCGSTQLAPMKRGFKIGRAIVGGALTCGLGGVIIGAAGRNKVELHCLKCGKTFKG
jgi:hypothetical protein